MNRRYKFIINDQMDLWISTNDTIGIYIDDVSVICNVRLITSVLLILSMQSSFHVTNILTYKVLDSNDTIEDDLAGAVINYFRVYSVCTIEEIHNIMEYYI